MNSSSDRRNDECRLYGSQITDAHARTSRSRRSLALSLTLVIIALAAIGAQTTLASGSPNHGRQRGRHHQTTAAAFVHRKLKMARHRRPLAVAAGDVSYPSEGILLAPTADNYTNSMSASEAVTSFRQLDTAQAVIGPGLQADEPATALKQVTESDPTYPGLTAGASYPAWVLTYTDMSPVFIGGGAGSTPPDASKMQCDDVGIYDLTLGKWTDVFQSCS